MLISATCRAWQRMSRRTQNKFLSASPSRSTVPSVDKGKHAPELQKERAGCVLGLGMRQHAFALQPCHPVLSEALGFEEVFQRREVFLTRQTTQLYFRKARRITQSGALPVLQNHVCLCQPRVSLFQLPERLSAQKAKRLFPFVFTKTAKKYTLNFSICNGATAVQ